MGKKITVHLQDEELYHWLKTEAVKRRRPASNIISEAVLEWLENHENPELLAAIKATRYRWKKKRHDVM
ncbi:MAG: hypothetical protein PHO26_02230 [Dehalococcoidia bacterium]|nr:hypothetical protein [Dehalococcoidia bacterium]MDD5494593.1 hypothetical protein [Dehalococcoidia bacterium]